jgi:hypothetical protein
MHPLVRGAAAAAVLTALGGLAPPDPEPPTGHAPTEAARGVDGLPAPCLGGTLPEGPVCVRLPSGGDATRPRLEADELKPSSRATTVDADRIARRPERPADPAVYVYPVGAERAPRILSGFDGKREGASVLPGVHLAARPGEKIVLLALDQQRGPAEVAFVGDLHGPTVVTRHEIEDGPRKKIMLLFHGRMDRPEPTIAAGQKLEPGATLGFARVDLGGGLIEVYLEARQLREGASLDGKKLDDPGVSLPVDLRDVLPRKN